VGGEPERPEEAYHEARENGGGVAGKSKTFYFPRKGPTERSLGKHVG